MKKVIYVFALLSLTFNFACSQKKAETQTVQVLPIVVEEPILATLHTFVKGGDEQNVAMLEKVLHSDYRISVNQFMGGEGVTIMKREDYLGMMRDKKIGGKARSFEVKSFQKINHTAQVHLHLESSELIFDNFLILVQDKAQQWTIVSDAVVAKPKG